MKIKAGSTNVSVYYYIVQDASGTSPGEPVKGLLFSDIETGGSASYSRQGAARVDLTLITLASASATHADGGFILVDDTNMPGLYRCDYPDAAFVTGVAQTFCQIVVASANNAVAAPILIDIDDNIDQTADNDILLQLTATATALADVPTVAEFNARTLLAGAYFDPAADAVANVTLVATTTLNTDMVAAAPTTAQIWAETTRVLTSGLNIVLAKGIGVTGFNDITTAQVNAEVLDVLVTDTFTEVTVPSATASIKDMIHYTFSRTKNKTTQTATTLTVRNDADSGNLGTATVSDDSTTLTKGKET